jgi:hypothetical protein
MPPDYDLGHVTIQTASRVHMIHMCKMVEYLLLWWMNITMHTHLHQLYHYIDLDFGDLDLGEIIGDINGQMMPLDNV